MCRLTDGGVLGIAGFERVRKYELEVETATESRPGSVDVSTRPVYRGLLGKRRTRGTKSSGSTS
jgi:hypothetical protein